jgi:two-component system, NtrC family, sensor kinase
VYSLVNIEKANEEFQIVNRYHLKVSLQAFSLETSQSSLLLLLKSLTNRKQTTKSKRAGLLKRWINITMEKRDNSYRKLKKIIGNKWNILREEDKTFLKRNILPLLKTVGDEIAFMGTMFESLMDKSSGEISKVDARTISRREHLTMTRIRRISAIVKNRVRRYAQRLEDNQESLLKQQIILLVAAMFLGIIVIILAARPLKNLVKLSDGARKLGSGDLSMRIPINSSDEIGLLAKEFNTMAEAIEEREERLIQSERLAAAGKLAAQIAHEIRNPLAAISFNVEFLDDTVKELPLDHEQSAEFKDVLGGLQKEVDRLTGITNEYLAFSRLPKPSLHPVDINAFLTDFLDFIEGELLLGQVEIVNDFQDKMKTVNLDEGLFRQVLLNLVRNSCESMEGGGTIYIITKQVKEKIIVKVKDTGKGMDKDTLDHIYEAFFTTKEHGTGLGMALARQIVEDHMGKIVVESKPQVGTTTTITFQHL